MERINIVSDKDKLLKSLEKLEAQFAEAKISKMQYGLEKQILEDKLSTILAADRIKKLQGRNVDEAPLEAEKKKEKEETVEKEALIKKYVTTPKKVPVPTKSSGMSKGKVSLIFLVAAFFVGTGYGVYVMSMPSNNSSELSLTVNDSAFPILNNTTNSFTNTTTNKIVIVSNKTSTKTSTTTNKSSSTTSGSSTKTLGNNTK